MNCNSNYFHVSCEIFEKPLKEPLTEGAFIFLCHLYYLHGRYKGNNQESFTHSDRQLSEELNVSTSTVENYKRELMEKVGKESLYISTGRFRNHKTGKWSNNIYTTYQIDNLADYDASLKDGGWRAEIGYDTNFFRVSNDVFSLDAVRRLSTGARYLLIYIYYLDYKLNKKGYFYHYDKSFVAELGWSNSKYKRYKSELQRCGSEFVKTGYTHFVKDVNDPYEPLSTFKATTFEILK